MTRRSNPAAFRSACRTGWLTVDRNVVLSRPTARSFPLSEDRGGGVVGIAGG